MINRAAHKTECQSIEIARKSGRKKKKNYRNRLRGSELNSLGSRGIIHSVYECEIEWLCYWENWKRKDVSISFADVSIQIASLKCEQYIFRSLENQ